MRNIERLQERAENMRRKPTFHEKKFSERMELAGLLFKSQYIIGNYIVDFLIGKIIVEIDGYSHFETFQAQYDVERTAYLEGRGYKVVRVRNEQVQSFDLTLINNKRLKEKGLTKYKSRFTNPFLESKIKKEEARYLSKNKKKYRVIEINVPNVFKEQNKIRFSYAELNKNNK